MKSSFGKMLVAGIVCAGFCFASVTVRAEDKKKDAPKKEAPAKEQTTVTGAAKAVANKTDATKKHLELTDKAGATYMLLSKKITAEEVAKFDGKNITVKGTVKDGKDGGKIIYVSGDITEAK
jgi:hypothetical protein